jgi:hypothetical protein
VEQIPWLYDAGMVLLEKTQAAVTAAGFAIDADSHRAQGDMRRFEARPR